MKSNIKVNNSDENKIILSVGMIVKNEEKHLDKCLSALKKLLDRIPSELIIVDTGSTDKTKEIALKYTDKVYDFEWIDDFAAARNYGLKRAVGEWFMFIDADEYMDENCEEMFKFFTMPEVNKKYNSASILLKNYSSVTEKANNQFLAPRVVRRAEGVEFYGKIHEWIEMRNPHGAFSTVFHHYGYAYSSKAEKEKKADRNVGPILEEYKKNPHEMRVLSHLCDVTVHDKYFKTYKEKLKYHIEFIEEAKKNLNHQYAASAFYKNAVFYWGHEKFSESLKVINEFEENFSDQNTIMFLAMSYFKISNLMNLENYEEAYEETQKYFDYYDKYTTGKLSPLDMRFCVLDGITESSLEQEYINASNCLIKLERYEEAIKYLNKSDLSGITFSQFRIYLNLLRDLTRNTQKYECAIKYYEKILEFNDDDKTGLILYLLSQYYLEHPLEREAFAEEVAESGVKGKFIDLMKICKDDFDGKDISNDIQEFINSITRWNDGYEEAIYLAMKHGADMSVPIKNMSNKLIKDTLQMIAEAHYDFAKVVLEYCNVDTFSSNIRNMLWMVTAFECAVPVACELSADDKSVFFDTYLQLLSDYVMNIYNPELLNPEDIEVLPELHRFGYYMTLAFTALNNGEEISYVRLLKEALRLCEPMKDVVSYYLSEFEKSMK